MTYAFYERLGVHCSESDCAVVRKIRAKLTPESRVSKAQKSDRMKLYRATLEHHHDWQSLAYDIDRGRI